MLLLIPGINYWSVENKSSRDNPKISFRYISTSALGPLRFQFNKDLCFYITLLSRLLEEKTAQERQKRKEEFGRRWRKLLHFFTSAFGHFVILVLNFHPLLLISKSGSFVIGRENQSQFKSKFQLTKSRKKMKGG